MYKLFSYKHRPVHMGPYVLENLTRTQQALGMRALSAIYKLAA